MTIIALLHDSLVIITLFMSAFLWLLASRNRLRRLSRFEELDSADINRIVTSMNRVQILNARAAMATALSALFAALRVILDIIAIAI